MYCFKVVCHVSTLYSYFVAMQCINTSAANVDTRETQKHLTIGSAVTFFEIDDEDLEYHTTQGVTTQYEEITEKLEVEEKSEEHANFTLPGQERIIGNPTAVAAATTYPFMAFVLSTSGTGATRSCTGVLITREYVLTAASCVFDADTVLVELGAIAPPLLPAIHGTAIVHPKFFNKYYSTLNSAYNSNYDIALIKLNIPQSITSTVNIVNVASKEETYDTISLAEKTMLLVGYGPPSVGGTAGMYATSMRVMSFSQCYRAMRRSFYQFGSHQSCLDTSSGTLGMCTQADVGAPVLYKFDTDNSYSLVGIANYFHSCHSSTPNVFTRIGPFRDLIRKNIRYYIPYYRFEYLKK